MCVKALSWPTWSYDIFSVCCLDLFIVRTNFFFNSIMTVRFWKSKNPALGIDLWDKVPCWGFLFLHQHFFLPSGLPLIQSNLVDPWLCTLNPMQYSPYHFYFSLIVSFPLMQHKSWASITILFIMNVKAMLT